MQFLAPQYLCHTSSPAAARSSETEVIDTVLKQANKLNYPPAPPLLCLCKVKLPAAVPGGAGGRGGEQKKQKAFPNVGGPVRVGGREHERVRETALSCFPKRERGRGMLGGESGTKLRCEAQRRDHICPPDVASTVVRHKEEKEEKRRRRRFFF